MAAGRGGGKKGRGTHGRRSPNGRRTQRAPPPDIPSAPPPPPPTTPSRRERRGANRGTAAARGESAQRRADAAASRGSPPGHASPGRGRARGLGPGREPPVPTGREPRGGGGRREAGHGPRTHGGKGTAGVRRRRVGGRAGRAPGNTAAEGGTANDGGPEDATPPHPPPPRAPAAWRETIPSPRHPRGSDTRRPLAARGSSQRGETDPGGPGRPGASAGALVPFSPLAGDVPPGHRGGGGGRRVCT